MTTKQTTIDTVFVNDDGFKRGNGHGLRRALQSVTENDARIDTQKEEMVVEQGLRKALQSMERSD